MDKITFSINKSIFKIKIVKEDSFLKFERWELEFNFKSTVASKNFFRI